MWRYLQIFLLYASSEVLEPSFPESPESGLGVRCTTSQDGLVCQRLDSVGQPMGSYAHACQALLFEEVDLVNQGSYLRTFEQNGLFTPGSLELRESAYEGGEAGFVVLTVEPCSLPSLEGIFQGNIKKSCNTHFLQE
jgi:hypothetical protein